jgi:hypothetical protein
MKGASKCLPGKNLPSFALQNRQTKITLQGLNLNGRTANIGSDNIYYVKLLHVNTILLTIEPPLKSHMFIVDKH